MNNPLKYTDPSGYVPYSTPNFCGDSATCDYDKMQSESFYNEVQRHRRIVRHYESQQRQNTRQGASIQAAMPTSGSTTSGSSTTQEDIARSAFETKNNSITLNQVVNFGVGLGDAVSFGIDGRVSKWVNGENSFDENSDAYSYGKYTSILAGGAGIAKGVLNFSRTTFIGTAQTTKTLGHGFISKAYGYFHAINDPRVIRVAFDVGYKRALKDIKAMRAKWGPRPDVMTVYRDGGVKVIEVASKTDKFDNLRDRNQRKIDSESLQGGISISKMALYLDKWFRR